MVTAQRRLPCGPVGGINTFRTERAGAIGSREVDDWIGSVGHSAQVFAPRHLIKAPRKEFKIISNLVVFIHWQDA